MILITYIICLLLLFIFLIDFFFSYFIIFVVSMNVKLINLLLLFSYLKKNSFLFYLFLFS